MKPQQVLSFLALLMLHGCALGQPAETKPDTVYVTRTGTKYHTQYCQYLKSSIATTLINAVQGGYQPCSACSPPTLNESSHNEQPTGAVHTNPTQPLVTPSKPASTQARQCIAYTKAGMRCKRTTTNSSGKCWQHE